MPPKLSPPNLIEIVCMCACLGKRSADVLGGETDLEAKLRCVRRENERLKNLLSESQEEVISYDFSVSG